MQWQDESETCRFHSALNLTNCHDGVDLPLCFEDTAILYGICAVFLVLAACSFMCGNSLKAKLTIGLLHSIKLVGTSRVILVESCYCLLIDLTLKLIYVGKVVYIKMCIKGVPRSSQGGF